MNQEPNGDNSFRADPPRRVETALAVDKSPPQAEDAARHPRKWSWKKRLAWIGAAAVALVVVTVFGWLESYGMYGLTGERAEQMVSAALPDGSTRDQVETWLDAHGIQHGRCGRFYTIQRNNIYPRLKTLPIESEVTADVPDAFTSWRGRHGGIQMFFFFDKDGKLLMHIVDGFFYGGYS
jgi:hypothetical protein